MSTIATLVLHVSCSAGQRLDWRERGQYELQLVVTHRAPLTPSRIVSIGPIKDTAVIEISIDSVFHDSLFGQYGAVDPKFGIMFGSVLSPPRILSGSVVERAFTITLSPHATDASLTLRGEDSTGNWVSLAHSDSGRFTLREVHTR